MSKIIQTKEGAVAYPSAINECLNFFSKAGSLYATTSRNPYYSGETSALELFRAAFSEDPITSLKLLFWLRDCRSGAGNRSGARSIIKHLGNTETELMSLNFHQIPVVGRWDDLKVLFTTPLREDVGRFWAIAINGGDILAAKWAKREMKPIRQALGLKESEFRKLLANLRKDYIVEHKMCQQEWDKIKYENVPSKAMSIYTNAFNKHDEYRFEKYKEDVKNNIKKVNASVLFPHDCIRTAQKGDMQMAELQFDALPNYFDGTDEKIMTICDSSGSMSCNIGGSVRAIDVSTSLSLYCSSKIKKDNPFYKRFISFCSEGKFTDWRGMSFSQAIRSRKVFNGAVGSTRIDLALKLILDIAISKKIPQRLMPTTLLIISDMQFSSACSSSYGWNSNGLSEKESLTEVDKMMIEFEKHGYNRPKIVFWNLAGYSNSQATVNSENVALISGFSPSILKAILSGERFDPYSVMSRAIEKYKVKIKNSEGKVIEV